MMIFHIKTKVQISKIKSWKEPLSWSILKGGQSTIEFAFAMIVVMFLIFGMVMVFRWAGMDLANRRYSQDSSLTSSSDPVKQLGATDNPVMPIAAMYHGSITDGNTSQ